MLRAGIMSGQPEYSTEARQLSLDLLRAVLDASKAHPVDDAACRAAASSTRDRLVCRVIDQHGRAQAQIIVNEAMTLTALLTDALAEHWGRTRPPAA